MASDDLTSADRGRRLAAAIAAGEVSAVEVTQAHLDRIARRRRRRCTRSCTSTPRARCAAARAVDDRRAAGEPLGPLAGVPLALKDVFTTADMPTTCGSKILEGWLPPYDATVTRRLREAGVVILGKTNMDEFAMGSSTENSAFGPTAQPVGPEPDPGRLVGRLGGRGRRVRGAAGHRHRHRRLDPPARRGLRHRRRQADLRRLVPVRPGRVRVLAGHAGPAGPHRARRGAAARGRSSGHDPCDSTSIDAPVPPVVAAARQADVAGLRIGVVTELGGEGYQPGVLARFGEAVELLESLGAKVVEVSCPHFGYALPAYYLIAPSECSSNLARFDAMRYGLRVGDDGTRSAEEVMALTRAAGLRRRGQAPDHARHLRAVQRLLRRLLRQGAEGPHADHPRLRRGVRAGRRAGLADHADHRVPDRRAGRRPDGDVPGRPVHHPVATWPATRRCRCRAGSRRRTACRSACRSWRRCWPTTGSTGSARPSRPRWTQRWGHPLLAEAKGLGDD